MYVCVSTVWLECAIIFYVSVKDVRMLNITTKTFYLPLETVTLWVHQLYVMVAINLSAYRPLLVEGESMTRQSHSSSVKALPVCSTEQILCQPASAYKSWFLSHTGAGTQNCRQH